MVPFRTLLLLIGFSLFFTQCGTVPPRAAGGAAETGGSEEEAGETEPAADQELPVEVFEPPRDGELLGFALEELSGELLPVLGRRGEPAAVIWREGKRVYCVVLCTTGGTSYRYDALTDLSRLYDQDARLFFKLVVIQWFAGRTYIGYSQELGEFPVLERFQASRFGSNESAPQALTVDFQSGEGGEEFLLFFGPQNAEQLRIRQNSASFARRRDLDEDGIDDILLYDAVYEEGTGKETFLTWYRWDGTGLTPYRSTNIVRNLNEFLTRSGRTLAKGRFTEFMDSYLLNEPSHKQGEEFAASFHAVFIPERESDPLDRISEEEFLSVTRVAFPEILENPFDIAAGDYRIELPVHFLGERDYRYRVRIAMAENPFEGRQFSFLRVLH